MAEKLPKDLRLALAACMVMCSIAVLAATAAGIATWTLMDETRRTQEGAERVGREIGNMDAAVQHHEDELERLRGEVKALREKVAALEAGR